MRRTDRTFASLIMPKNQRAIRNFALFIRATVVGGLVFLLPFGIVLLVVGRLYATAKPIGQKLHELIFPQSTSNFWPLVFSVAVLIGIAFLAGIFARSGPGRRTFEWLESTLLSRFPPYTILRQMLDDYVDGDRNLATSNAVEVVMVHFDDYSCPAFVVEKRADTAVLFLPGAPSATSGSVAIVKWDRVEPTDLTPLEVMQSMRRLGRGLDRA
ncbi:DUF502 domain-containing protein [Paracoccus aestuariivivens]|uniref:DUF502 domain-containing protein n=1 Tax=Paracoccus aestuariivivens TaxID=1820333 RepID=A0A6L6J8J6_9RHOB|nr:DUF502 domain-containing protein [Paracoccus aestuariivivens]MTH76957.1 DUF502 domain-containing protein [Paracoccus aestuariivivens]